MPFRGWFTIDGWEIANSSRVAKHLGRDLPTRDFELFGVPGNVPDLFTEDEDNPGLYNPGALDPDDDDLYPTDGLVGTSGLYPITGQLCGAIIEDGFAGIPPTSIEVSPGLYTPPNGARRFGPGLYVVSNDCWEPAAICSGCESQIPYSDEWTGLTEFLGDYSYRPELAPWYTTELPESGEFGGVWVTKVDGLDVTPIERPITDAVGHGGVAGPYRDAPRRITFEALLIGCTNAGVDFGLKWLTCLLRGTNTTTNSTLRYLAAHPGDSGVDPASLVREVHGVVVTKAPEIADQILTGAAEHRQANIYRVTWEMTALSPYAWLPPVDVEVDWDTVTRQPYNWMHAADCHKPETCEDMPVMFSAECVPEEIGRAPSSPPPVCGGCLPISGIDKYSFTVPTQDYAFRCRDTAVSMVFTNTSSEPLNLQAFWRVCGTDFRCEDDRWPLQISGLPPGAELHLDGVTGRYWAHYDERIRRPVGVVGTPNGAPWRPPLIDRTTCWEFVVQTAPGAEFTTSMTLRDRDP